jgi:hypothetical protein
MPRLKIVLFLQWARDYRTYPPMEIIGTHLKIVLFLHSFANVSFSHNEPEIMGIYPSQMILYPQWARDYGHLSTTNDPFPTMGQRLWASIHHKLSFSHIDGDYGHASIRHK